jgi:hypothetical protein
MNMKRNVFWLGMLAMVLTFGMTAVGCDDGSGDTNPPERYEGTAEGTTYTLTIDGDSYVLTLTAADGTTKTSRGTVTKNGNAFTLTPSYSGADTFTITVSPSGITDIDGEITLDNGEKEDPPDTVTPKPPAPPNTGGSNPPLKVVGALVYTYYDDGEYTAFAGTGTAMDVKALITSFTPGDDARHDLGPIGTISGNGKLTFELPPTIADDKLFPLPDEYGVNGKVGWVYLVVSDGAYELDLKNDSGAVLIEYFDRDINAMGISVKKGWNYFVLSSYDDPPQIISDISNFKWVIYESGGGGGGNSALNGTWVNGTDKTVLNNGAITMSSGNVEMMKGTYSTSGSNMTVTFTQVKAAMFGEDASDMGLSPDQWYTQQQLKAAIIKVLVDEGMDQSEAEEMYDEWGVSEVFESSTGTYTLSGNTLTVTMGGTPTVLTRQ